MKTRDSELTWQIVDYTLGECNNKVYALSPFGSSYLRSYFQTALNLGLPSVVNGAFDETKHLGADWSGRSKIDQIINKGKGVLSALTIPGSIYKYELERLSTVYTEADAKTKLENELREQVVNMPIVAVAPGRVETVAFAARSGFYVTIEHAPGVYTSYMHLKRWPLVNKDDYVGAGTYLGYEGNTGRSFGKHLHFEIKINDKNYDPVNYVYPTFNYFYNKELAEKDEYNMMSDYMSLYRTVSMVGDGAAEVKANELNNNVPSQCLIEDYTELIQKQGVIERTADMHGELGWGYDGSYDGSDLYSEYLEDKEIFDLYLKDAYYDIKLAEAQGYFVVPFELLSILYGNITVKTDMPGGLPALTREELDHILKYWLPARYKSEEKVKWLMDNVFTEENINIMLEVQEKYKVSIVFMLAVAVQEQNIGLSKTALALPPACNIFSIKGSLNGGIRYQNGKLWNKYESYGAAFEGFARLIAETGPYFSEGRFTIGTIAPVYCEGNTWGNAVAGHVMEIMQYYIGSDWSFPAGGSSLWFGDNAELITAAKNCFAYASYHKFAYCQRGCAASVPPYKGTPINGDFSSLPTKKSPTTCPHDGSGAGIFACKIDCSKYVSWVLYEYAKANNLTELASLAPGRAQSGWYRDVGKYLYGQETGKKVRYENCDSQESAAKFGKYFQLVWHIDRDGPINSNKEKFLSLIQPGDIFASKDSSGQGHVEIYIGKENDTEKFNGRASSTNSTGCAMYSCGLYKKRNVPTTYGGESDGIKCVVRPLPPHMIDTSIEEEL